MAPGQPVIEVSAPTGAVVETAVTFVRGGEVQPFAASGRLVDGQEIVGTRFSGMTVGDPGSYEAVDRRVGVTGSGIADLERRLPFRVRAVPAPPLPPLPRPLTRLLVERAGTGSLGRG